jgi:hypothetical protein
VMANRLAQRFRSPLPVVTGGLLRSLGAHFDIILFLVWQ